MDWTVFTFPHGERDGKMDSFRLKVSTPGKERERSGRRGNKKREDGTSWKRLKRPSQGSMEVNDQRLMA